MTQLQTAGAWPDAVVLVLLALLMGGAWWLYYRESRYVHGNAAWLLPTLRALAIGLAILLLMEPTYHRRWQVGEPARLDVFLDHSRSMSVVDTATDNDGEPTTTSAGDSRYQKIDSLLLNGEPSLLQQWQETHNLTVYQMDDQQISRIAQSNATVQTLLPNSFQQWATDHQLAGWGKTTQIGQFLTEWCNDISSQQSQSAADKKTEHSLLLVSDGQDLSGSEVAQLTSKLQDANIQVHAIGMGPRAEDRDLAVANIQAPNFVYYTDRVSGEIELWDRHRVSTTDTTPLKVRLQIRSVDFPTTEAAESTFNSEQPLWSTQVSVDGSGRKNIRFGFQIRSLVEQLQRQWKDRQYAQLPLKFVVTCETLSHERSDLNNQRTFQVAVGTRQQRVLLLAGRSRWEMRFLRNSLERDENWQVDSFLLGSNGPRIFSQGDQSTPFPQSQLELLQYDLVVLGEVAPNHMPPGLSSWLTSFVGSSGGGLLVVDGGRNVWQRPSQDSIADWFPVIPGSSHYVQGNELQAELTDFGFNLGATQLSSDVSRSRQLWTQLPKMNRVTRVEVRPGAQVIANLIDPASPDQPFPYLVGRTFGAGRVVFATTDQSWRWRYGVEDRFHQRFWNQMGRWIMRSPFMLDSEWVSLDCGKVFHSRNASIPFRVRLKGLDGQPARLESVRGLVQVANVANEDSAKVAANDRKTKWSQSVELTPVPDYPGVYQGQISGLPPEEYQFSVLAPGYQLGMLNHQIKFTVTGEANKEMLDLTCNENWLQQLCDATGGVYVHQTEPQPLSEAILERTAGKYVESDFLLWQSYFWFLPLVALLGWEWWLRKKVGLI